LGSATAVLLLSASSRPVRFGLALAAVFAAARTRPGAESDSALLRAERSFFGVYRVLQAPRATVRTLVHGTTVHGAQATDPARRLDPLTYYHRAGPIGDLFGIVPAANAVGRQVGLVGLGIGSLACYGRPGERWTYYEIDPVVLEIARDPRLFTFLRDCAPRVDVVLGDARLTLGKAPTAAYDVLVLDAFSSDAIPVHLLTREAFALYRRVLAPHGVLAVHISNRHLNLEPIVSGLAQHAGLTARVRRDVNVSPAEQAATGRSAAIWVLLADAPEDLGPLASDARWAALQKSGDVWTDDFSNVLSVLTWR
jgi:SAM-dependent methyltransferase